jgi:hypothetical protein
MSEPIVLISHFRVNEGMLDAYKQLQCQFAKRLQAEKPRTLVFLTYLDADGARITAIHVFADAESMDLHFQGTEERSRAASEILAPESWEIYGTPSDQALETMRQEAASSGARLTVQGNFAAGFLRVTSS